MFHAWSKTAGVASRALTWPRLPWWLETLTLSATYVLYEGTRLLAVPRTAVAVSHGVDLDRLERWAHLDPEVALNHLLQLSEFSSDLAGYYYSSLHFIVTGAVLIVLWRRHPDVYPRLRSALVVATLVALVVFTTWPAAPPRFAIAGLSDTLLRIHMLGLASGHGVSPLINQYAAMPSLHVGWAVWSAAAVVTVSQSPWRQLAWLYPVLTSLVVMATANHYLLDAVAGGLLTLGAVALLTPPPRHADRVPIALRFRDAVDVSETRQSSAA